LVSKLHAEFQIDGDDLWVNDLQSTNGTFLNGERVSERVQLISDDLVQFADVEFRVVCTEESALHNTICDDLLPGFSTTLQFRRLLTTCDVIPYFQPVVALSDGSVLGYEVLARSDYDGLRSAPDLFRAAARLGREGELSQLCRWEGLRQGQALPGRTVLFVNTHPSEIGQPGFIESLLRIREQRYGTPVILEIHEQSVCDISAVREMRSVLRELGMGFAYDDFGNGQSRLMELLEVPPDVVKFDMSLIRDIHLAPRQRQHALLTLVTMVRDLGVAPLAEGVECHEEAEVCRELGFQYVQGYLFGKPMPLADIVSSQIDRHDGDSATPPPNHFDTLTPWQPLNLPVSADPA
jgi:EAL domain-containing protein (putative c-di-GMP-specific phosphodiesterase class I)